MYKGIYIALSGQLLRYQELNNVSNNLANTNTFGFKKTLFASSQYPVQSSSVPGELVAYPGARTMSYYGNVSIDNAQGTVKKTGNQLDLAIEGKGFFVLEGDKGTFYTRNGAFQLDSEGFLVGPEGRHVVGESGSPIQIEGSEVDITPEGEIFVDGNVTSRLKLVDLDGVEHVRESLFTAEETKPSESRVVQGALELSNSSPVRELVGVMKALREFEITQKVIKTFDTLSQRAVTEIAKL